MKNKYGKSLAEEFMTQHKHVEKIMDQKIDLTPDEDLPLRILKAYRERCDYLWHIEGELSKGKKMLYEGMNKQQRKRAEILDRAISVLEKVLEGEGNGR